VTRSEIARSLCPIRLNPYYGFLDVESCDWVCTRSRPVPGHHRGRGDVRILDIFEGAAEIQAQIIARGLVAGRN
jgi:hypothetical protein